MASGNEENLSYGRGHHHADNIQALVESLNNIQRSGYQGKSKLDKKVNKLLEGPYRSAMEFFNSLP